MKNKLILLVIVLVFIGGWLYIRSRHSDSMEGMDMPYAAEENAVVNENPVVETTATTTSSAPAQRAYTVLGSNYAFAPKQLLAKKGDTVTITFKNTGGFHDFRIDAFNVATKQIGAGKEETVTFVATKSGMFEFYCSVGNHRAMGMVGTLTVTE